MAANLMKLSAPSPACPARRPTRSTRRCAVTVKAAIATPLAVAEQVAKVVGTAPGAELTKRIVEDEAKYILQTYGRPGDMVLTHGQGSKLYDANGKEYLDFAAGIAVNALGHGDPRWFKALTEQAAVLSHTSNLFHSVPQVDLAKRLVENSFADKCFYCNSGTEANEGAIKFARKWARVQAGVDPYDGNAVAPYELVSFTNCFHGRTLGALTLTYKEQYKTPFYPVIPGHHLAEYNNLESAEKVIVKGKTAAVFVEPVQGEGGITPATLTFLQGLRKLCDERGALLVFDEIRGLGRTGKLWGYQNFGVEADIMTFPMQVQCGLGRTGKLWGYQNFGVEPDIMTLAKPLAGGLPIGAVLLKQHVADCMKPGDHGSTFAGNPLVCGTACTVFDIIAEPAFLQAVLDKGEHFKTALRAATAGNPHVKEVRGMGLLVGVQLDQMASKVVDAARAKGLIVITAGKGDVVRMVPPLVVTKEEIEKAATILGGVLAEVLV